MIYIIIYTYNAFLSRRGHDDTPHKTTLIRIMSGSDRPHSGTVRKDMPVSWPLAFGDVFQGSLTGKDNARAGKWWFAARCRPRRCARAPTPRVCRR
ncbi:capsule polysaccharide export ATP-binding protein [Burkholderiales bacterium GJ-E10]|nr:capsule polysaccharide export ATP-binding protein [Burkholderiales bacterium GJ-E10]